MYNNRKKNSQAPRKTKAEVAEEKATNGYESIKRSYPWKQHGLPIKPIKN